MGFKISYVRIKSILLKIFLFLWSLIKTFFVIFNFTWRWIGGAAIIILSIVIWLPISIWKTGLIVSDHIMKHMTNDK